MQHNLFRNVTPDLNLEPVPGRSEPRLWVRRLIIWRDKNEVLREITLRPGLNVIWSPDAVADGVSIGHGGGKTTFCRLLRYCLGEDSFAPTGQRRATFDKMPNGRVGIEVRLDGQDWAIVRAFSNFNEDWAITNATLDQSLEGIQPTGMGPFRIAATEALLGDAVQLMPKSIGEIAAWPAVLSWLTRDQECRFSHLLDWRDKDSESNSPVRGRSVDERLTIVRAVLGALTAEELSTEAARTAAAEQANKLTSTISRLDWQIGRWRDELVGGLGLGTGLGLTELDAAVFSKIAAEKLTAAIGLAKQQAPTDVSTARAEQKRLEGVERVADNAVQRRVTEISERDRTLKLRKSELPQLSAAAATVPTCALCHSPISALHTCDTRVRKDEFDRALAGYKSEEAELATLRMSEGRLRQAHAIALQQLDLQRKIVDKLFHVAGRTSAVIQRAQALVADVGRYERLLQERKVSADELERLEVERDRLKGVVDQKRSATRELLNHLSERCDLVVRHLVPGEVSGSAVLDGKGLHLHIKMGGDRSTAAIESLKVVIFDLAMLTLAIEGRTRFPSFLVHDSPREADLDLLVYHRLFDLIQTLEQYGPAPQFQYVVTTTTAPPQQILDGEALRLTLKGAPPEGRLLMTDL